MVYFIEDTTTGAVKIGYSDNPSERLAELQVGNASELVLLATLKTNQGCERHLHERFSKRRLRGEWFATDTNMRNLIEAARLIERIGCIEGGSVLLPDLALISPAWAEVWLRACGVNVTDLDQVASDVITALNYVNQFPKNARRESNP